MATSLLVVAAVVYVVAKRNEDASTAVGYVRAVAEAAMIGALADWFAVTALFRHPLRLPIPHTAIIPERKDEIGRSLGSFVESNFLTPELIRARLAEAAVARRAGEWLSDPAHAARAASAVADVVRTGSDMLDDAEIQHDLARLVESRVRATPLSPLVGRSIEFAMRDGYQARLLDALLTGAREFVTDNREALRRRIYQESPWWVPEGIDDRVFDRVEAVVLRFLADVRADPVHEVRRGVDSSLADLARRLREDPALLRRGEELTAEVLDHDEVRRWIDSLWGEAKESVLTAIADPDGDLRRRIASAVEQLGRRLATDPDLQARVDRWSADAAGRLVDSERSEIAELIATTVEGWDGESTADKLELQVGRDLQFIRINGTVIGGLAGFVIHAVGQLL